MQSERDARDEAEDEARFAARTTAEQVGDAITLLQGTVAQLAATPNVEGAISRPEECSLSFGGPNGVESGHVDVLRADGTVACSSRPTAGEEPFAPYTEAAWLRQAKKTGKAFEAPIVDAGTGQHSAVSAAPIPGGYIAGFLALEPAGPALAKLYGGGRPVEFLITDRDRRTVLARSIDPERWVGTSLAGTEFADADGTERPDLNGTERLYADATVPGTGWTFFAGEDKDAALAAASDLRERQLLIIAVGLAFVLAAAFVVYRRVALPVTRLGEAVRSTSRLSPPAPVPVSGPAEVTALGEDVNDLIESVNRSERNYRLLFESSPLPMWIYDLETLAILEVNDAAVTAYGYSRDEFLALTMTEIEAGSSRHRKRDGTVIDVHAVWHDVTFGGTAARFVLAEDVGERERLEGQLRQAQRMEAIGRLAGGVAHDFNNLLTAVIGYSDLLLDATAESDPRRHETEEIKKAGERAVALTRQLLTFGRSEPPAESAVLDLNATVVGIEPMLSRLTRDDIVIELKLLPGAAHISADGGQIEQVLVNLVVNAGHAMPGGGTVTISTSAAELDDEYFRLHPAGQAPAGPYVLLEVADTGVGMDEETLSHVFEPFFTTKNHEHGTGLGLATVYGIVRQSEGFIWAYSELGRGTVFKIYLPAVEAAVEAPPEEPQGAVPGAAGRTVLLVEDDHVVRRVVRRMLEGHAFEILEAADGQGALALSDAQPADSIDILISDTVIPGPGGLELTTRIREAHPGLRTLLMSGYSEKIATGDQPLGPRTEFIAKPFSAADLNVKLAALLR